VQLRFARLKPSDALAKIAISSAPASIARSKPMALGTSAA
jgi:hypothetical protein